MQLFTNVPSDISMLRATVAAPYFTASEMNAGQADEQEHSSGLLPQGAATLLQSGGGRVNPLGDTLFG